ncbi:MAG: alkaline phosphatase family protein, partial [Planctomycetes bacterium]|nr:alkaline phosphatase family protein [Planctomycetota bacterium]
MSKFSAPRRALLKSALSFALTLPLAGRASADAPRKKVVVLGLDAIDPRLLEGFWNQGLCQNLKKLLQQGHYSPLESCHPPMSPAAWSTMTTGLNPGKTGITGFLKRKPGSYEPTMALADANETALFGGSTPNRVGYAFAVAMAALGASALLGKGGKRIADNLRAAGAPKPHRLIPATSTLALIALVPLLGTAAGPLLAIAAGLAVVCTLVLGYSAATGRLKPGEMIVPFIGLASAVFAVLRRFPETMPQPTTGRRGETFWATLARNGYRCKVLAAPVDWPAAERMPNAEYTTGLGTPDALGTFHTFTLFTEPYHALVG